MILTNVALVLLVTGMIMAIGLKSFLLVQVPITLIASSLGVWLFYVQHQFERTYWQNRTDWDFQRACLEGSSFYDLPRVLHWFTGNIGFHHVHHLCAAIPNYRLNTFLDAHPELRAVSRIGLRDGLRCARLALWDEERSRLIGFREISAESGTSPA